MHRKALIISAVALVMGGLCAPGTAWAEDGHFTDDNGNPHEGYIEAVAAEGIASGCTATKYCPDSAVTRAQMATFLARGYALPAATTDHFTDDNGSPHEDNINRVAQAGIATGSGGRVYNPAGIVTRGQMAAFIARAADLPPASQDYFTDDNDSPHEDNINRVAAAGIASGTGASTYGPDAAVTRAQMATFLGRALGLEEALINPETDYLADMTAAEGYMASGSRSINGEDYPNSLFAAFGGCIEERTISFDLGRDYKVFRAAIGMSDDSKADSVIRMEVLIDGQNAGSWTMRLGDVQMLDLNVRNALRLQLNAYFVEGTFGICSDSGEWVWGDARVLT